MTNNNYKNWKVEHDAEGIAWLHIDKADAKANVLSSEVLNELADIIETLEKSPPKGVVILSDKKSGFIAGADVKEFTKIVSMEQALEAVRRGHSVFNALEGLKCPTVALISGFCLGGGLELALACNYRIADNDPSCKLGLPEVNWVFTPALAAPYA